MNERGMIPALVNLKIRQDVQSLTSLSVMNAFLVKSGNIMHMHSLNFISSQRQPFFPMCCQPGT